MLWICGLLWAGPEAPEGAPGAGAPQTGAPQTETPQTETPQAETSEPEAPVPGQEVEVQGAEVEIIAAPEVARARDELIQRLRAEGYTRVERRDGATVLLHALPYHPQVIIHDDGWIEVKRSPIRFHSPGRQFADEGPIAAYLWCIIAPHLCVSPGGLVISKRKLDPLKAEVYDSTRFELRQLNDAVAAVATERRIGHDIPEELARIWGDASIPAPERRRRLLELWDSRTDTPEGEAARQAIEAFLNAVVQGSAEPFTVEELTAFEARRTAPRPLSLRPAG